MKIFRVFTGKTSWSDRGQGFGILLLLSAILFAVSVALRFKYFGDIASGNSEASTGDILRWTRMWFEEGPASVRFQMPDLFKSIESPDLSSRGIYLSYPPGVVLFPYLISLLVGHYPSPSTLMGVNLLGHFFAGVCAGRIIQICLVRSGCKEFFTYGSVAIALILVYFSRGPFYFLQNVYVHDTAVILWISLLTIVELQIWIDLNQSNKLRAIYFTLLFIFSFLALFTDWSAYFVLFLFFLVNLFCYQKSKKPEYLTLLILKSVAVILSLLFYMAIIFLNDYQNLLGRFSDRFGLGAGIGVDQKVSFDPRLLLDIGMTIFNLPTVFFALLILLGYFAYFFSVVKKDQAGFSSFEKRYIYFIVPFGLFLGGILYNLFFFNHTYFHLWSGIKFTIPIAFLVAISPLVILFFSEKFFKRRWLKFFLYISWFPAVFLAGYTLKQCFDTGGLFPPRDRFAIEYRYLDSVREKLIFSDVVFSYDFSVGQKTLQSAYLSRPVYRVQTPDEVIKKLTAVGNNATAILFYRSENSPSPWNNALAVINRLGDYGGYHVVRLALKSKAES